ncbi:MAG: rod shape-determining protein MreD, partial [Burkholderiales bacterium]|nr:rod shape-determining protein MreD [Burkholderiales bacterium]
PAPLRLLVGSFVVAFLLNLLPWSGVPLQICPDFVLFILLYWSVQEPRSVGQGLGFLLGLLMDVADSALLGQHALVYVVVVFFAQLLRVRVLQLNLPAQALHVAAVLILAQLIAVSLNLSLGRELPGLWVAFAPFVGALLWPVISLVLALPGLRLRPGQRIS